VEFYKYWRSRTDVSDFRQEFPYDQTPTPCNNSLMNLSSRENYLPTFMLARLILAQQVVLLCDPGRLYLFYQGIVYSQPTCSHFEYLPEHKSMDYFPIWTLIDWDSGNWGPPSHLTQTSGQSNQLPRTPFDGRVGSSEIGLLCWGCPHGV